MSVAFGIASAAEDDAYVIVRAVVIPIDHRQPTWIAFTHAFLPTGTHIRANGVISPIRPGTYRMSHIDFTKFPSTGYGSIKASHGPVIKLMPGSVNFIGTVQVDTRANADSSEWTVFLDPSLMARACLLLPTLIERSIIHFPAQVLPMQPVQGKCAN